MLREEYLHQLLEAANNNDQVDIYQFSSECLAATPDLFAHTRIWSHCLVKEKLCAYMDEEKTQIRITHYGRYWMMHQGYMGFLRDEHVMKERELKEKDLQKEVQKDILLEARLKLTHYRLIGFWLALSLAIIGLLVSGFNFYLYLNK